MCSSCDPDDVGIFGLSAGGEPKGGPVWGWYNAPAGISWKVHSSIRLTAGPHPGRDVLHAVWLVSGIRASCENYDNAS